MTTAQTVAQMSSDLLLIGVAFEVGLHQSVAPHRGAEYSELVHCGIDFVAKSIL